LNDPFALFVLIVHFSVSLRYDYEIHNLSSKLLSFANAYPFDHQLSVNVFKSTTINRYLSLTKITLLDTLDPVD